MKGQIEKRGAGVYRLRWFLGRDAEGKRQYGSKTVRGTKKDAEKALREVLARKDEGYAVPSPARLPTLREFFAQWKDAGAEAAGIRDRTFRDYGEILERHVLPPLGGMRLDTIHAPDVKRAVRPLWEAGKNRSAQLAVAALSAVFRTAVDDPTYGLRGNPCHRLKLPAKPSRRVPPLTQEERGRFRAAIRGAQHEDLFLLLMFTGLSPHEAFALGWEHVALEAGEITVCRTADLKARRLVDATKRRSRRRTVPLVVPELRARLRKRWLAAGRPAEGLVFPGREGRVLHLDTVRGSHFLPALERAGIARPMTIYTLRHGFATAALEGGADIKTVAELMGHSSTRMALEVYTHVSDARKKEAAERIGAALSGQRA